MKLTLKFNESNNFEIKAILNDSDYAEDQHTDHVLISADFDEKYLKEELVKNIPLIDLIGMYPAADRYDAVKELSDKNIIEMEILKNNIKSDNMRKLSIIRNMIIRTMSDITKKIEEKE